MFLICKITKFNGYKKRCRAFLKCPASFTSILWNSFQDSDVWLVLLKNSKIHLLLILTHRSLSFRRNLNNTQIDSSGMTKAGLLKRYFYEHGNFTYNGYKIRCRTFLKCPASFTSILWNSFQDSDVWLVLPQNNRMRLLLILTHRSLSSYVCEIIKDGLWIISCNW